MSENVLKGEMLGLGGGKFLGVVLMIEERL